MLLAIDVGNTNTVIGLLEDGVLRFRWRIASEAGRTSDEHSILMRELCSQSGVDPSDIRGLVVSSVVPTLTDELRRMSEVAFGVEPLVVGPDVDLGITIDYDDPREVGPDRLANAVAARHLAKGAAIVVDFGTATTIDAVTSDGRYLGGAIAPGLLTSAENLFRRAALLHRVALVPPERAIGRSTEDALRAGIVFGAAGQVDEIVGRVRAELGEECRVLATGGLAERIALFARTIDAVEPDLTLLGLSLIHARVKTSGD